MTTTSDLKDNLPDFEGRVLFIYLNAKKALLGHYIVSPHFERQGGRIYLVGTTPSIDRLPNHPICIAWDRVETYVVADSIDEFAETVTDATDEYDE